MNFIDMAKKMKDMHGEMKKAKAALEAISVTGQAGRGAVTVEMTGAMTIKQVKIDPKVFERPDAQQLESQVKEAFAQALEKAQKVAASQMQHLVGPGLGF